MNIAKIHNFDTANGEGFRVSIYTQGCSHHCKGCFNTSAWDFHEGRTFINQDYEDIKQMLKNPSIAGLSILGGEPLDQSINGLQKLIDLCCITRGLGKNVWLWTGYTWEDIIDKTIAKGQDGYRKSLIKCCDVVVDGEFVEELKDLSLAFRGSSNQRIIDVKKSLKKKTVVLYERMEV